MRNETMKIGSTVAFLVYLGVMVAGYVWATFLPDAPYVTLAEFLTIGATAFWAKRLIQRSPRLGGATYAEYRETQETTEINGECGEGK